MTPLRANLRKKRTRRRKLKKGAGAVSSPTSLLSLPSQVRSGPGPNDVVAPLDADFDRFVEHLRARLVAGAREYGDRSFQRPAAELIDELQQEVEDIAGWGLILWIRLERLRGRVGALDEGGNNG